MTLYKFRLSPDSQLLEDAQAVDRLRSGWDYLEQAISLWHLVDPARAAALSEFMERLSNAGDGPICFSGEDLVTLTRMIAGIEDANRSAGIIDRDGRVAPERLAELKRCRRSDCSMGEAVWEKHPDLDAVFAAPPEFANVPTWFVALPTRSRWVVLWNNSFLCDGYDSLCWCLTRNHGLTTVHWSAHDTTTTFQPGAAFHHRRRDGEALVERSVSCSATDGRWAFAERGEPLPEEDLSGYGARRKRDRLDERRVAALLARLGAEPWAEGFYEVADRPCFVVRRTAPPATVHTRPPAAVVARR